MDISDKSATASPSLYLEVWCSLQYHGDNHLRHLLSTPYLAFRSTSGRIRLVLLLPTVPRSALLVSCPSTGDTITTHYAAEYLSLPSQLTAHQPAILGRQALTTAYVTLPPDAALLEQLPLLSRCALRCRSTSGLCLGGLSSTASLQDMQCVSWAMQHVVSAPRETAVLRGYPSGCSGALGSRAG